MDQNDCFPFALGDVTNLYSARVEKLIFRVCEARDRTQDKKSCEEELEVHERYVPVKALSDLEMDLRLGIHLLGDKPMVHPNFLDPVESGSIKY